MAQSSIFKSFSETLRLAVESSGMVTPTPPQVLAWPHIVAGENVLLVAPTGTGKTEAALLPALDRLIRAGSSSAISILYITPMRALNRDMMKRLEFWGAKLNLDIQVRHGDTSAQTRRKQSLKPPDILITTPETLQAILPGTRMREHLKSVKVVVVDEVHALVESKRGVQLVVGLQRLAKLADYQLVGLSATIGDVKECGRFLFSNEPYKLLKVDMSKKVRYSIDYPVPSEADNLLSREIFATSELAARLSAINDLLDTHDSALIFVNSRTVAEMVGEKLGRIRKDVAVHHGSLPREERERVEEAFKEGRLKALVCTSTLELGIDVGSVDLVIQYMSPRQVTSMIQRVGRSGHSVGRTSEGVLISVSTDDILESAAVITEALDGKLEKTRPFINSLDVLAHQIVGYLMDFESIDEKDLLGELKKTHPYRGLEGDVLRRVINYLASLGKLWVQGDVLKRNRASREYYYENLSMIPDETRYMVIDLASDQRVGILGEEFMLFKARIGLHFICKGKVWQIEKISDDHKVFVTPSDDPLAAVPAWDGEMLPIPYQLAQRVGYTRRAISDALELSPVQSVVEDIQTIFPAPIRARQKVIEEIMEHKQMRAPVPSDRLVLVEGFQKYLIIHTCFGEGVNRAIALVSEEILSRKGLVRLWWTDAYRILIELTVDASELDLDLICSQLLHLPFEEFERTFNIAVQRNFPFPNRLKSIGERFGALKRGKLISHPNLCSLPTRFENTPIFEEAIQEMRRDLVSMEDTQAVIRSITAGDIKVQSFQADENPTPIAYHILYRYMDVPELVASETILKSSVDRMRASIYSTQVDLVCFKCGNIQHSELIGSMPKEPFCPKCASTLIAPCFWYSKLTNSSLKKKLNHEELSKDEILELSKARRAADLVLAYGKAAIIAQAVYGIGPQTASKVLAKMHDDEESFYRDLLESKLKFISTRPFWSK